MDKLTELEQRRAQRRADAEAARATQYLKDLEAVEELEASNGYELDISLRVPNFKAGLPSLVGVRAPNELEYKRFFQSLNRAGNADGKMMAHEQLAKVCWEYPADPEAKKAMLAATPGLMAGIGNKAIKLAEAKSEDEGKD